MTKITKVNAFFLYIAAAAGALWLGSYVSRFLVTYQLFDAETMSVKSYLLNADLVPVFITITPIISFAAGAYAVFLIFSLLFIVKSNVELKANGWLFITLLLIIITAPYEIYLIISIDLDIIFSVYSGNFTGNEILQSTVDRVRESSFYVLILLLSYLSIIFLILFQPLKRKPAENED